MFLAALLALAGIAPAMAGQPSVPRNLRLDGLDNGLRAEWDAPADNGGSAITSYIVRVRLNYCAGFIPGSGGCWITTANPGSDNENGINVGLVTSKSHRYGSDINGRDMDYWVRAENAEGTQSDWTPLSRVTSGTPPRVSLTEVTSVEGGARVVWARRILSGEVAPAGFSVRWRRRDASFSEEPWTVPDSDRAKNISSADARTYTITGLQNATAYEVQAASINGNSRSQWTQPPTVVTAGSSDAALSGLSMKSLVGVKRTITFDQALAADRLAYTATVPFINESIQLELTPKESSSNIAIGGTALQKNASSVYTYTTALAEGGNTFAFTVTPTDEISAAIYSVTVTRAHILLSALEVTASEVNEVPLSPSDLAAGGELALRPAFAPDVRAYNLPVTYHAAKLRLRMAADVLTSEIHYHFGNASQAPYKVATRLEDLTENDFIELSSPAGGEMRVFIQLTDLDGGEENYELHIQRERKLFLPDRPHTLRADAGAAKIDVEWRAPDAAHGSDELPLDGYRVRWRSLPDGLAVDAGNWQDASGDNEQGELVADSADDVLTYAIGGLYFLPYEVQVAAANADGISLWTAVETGAVQVPAPDAAYELSLVSGSQRLQVQLPLTSVHNSPGFSHIDTRVKPYRAQIKLADGAWPAVDLRGAHLLPPGIIRISSPDEEAEGIFRFTGLQNGVSYDVRTFYTYYDLTTEESLAGPFSPAQHIDTVAPKVAPTLQLVSRDGALTAKWTLPDNVFASDYRVRWKEASAAQYASADRADVDAREPEYMISGLTNKTRYEVQVAARNSFGTGPWSAAQVLEPGRLDPPAGVVATGGTDGELALKWSAPPGIAGDSLSAYHARWAERATPDTWLNEGGASGQSTGSLNPAYTITELTNRTEYLVQIAAGNSLDAANFSEAASGTPFAPIAFASEQGEIRFHETGDAARQDLPRAQGGLLPYAYTMSRLPEGLSFRVDAGSPSIPHISGMPKVSTATATATYRATHAAGGGKTQVIGIATRIPPSIAASDRTFTVGEDIDTTLAAASGGFAPYSYSLAGDLSGLASSGVSVAADARAITGIAHRTGVFTFTYAATDDSGRDSGRVEQEVILQLILGNAFPPAPREVKTIRGDSDGDGADDVLLSWKNPPDSGGALANYKVRWKQAADAAALDAAAWSATVDVPKTGDETESTSHTLAAVPQSALVAAQIAGIYSHGEAQPGPWGETKFGIPLVLGEIDDLFFYTTRTNTARTMPQASGGAAPLLYALSGLPSGLSFTPATRFISGAPAAAGKSTLTYTATDADGNAASRVFDLRVQTFGLDVDDDGKITARDGIMIARHLLGVSGDALTAGQSNATSGTVAQNIELGVANLKLDVNDDKAVDGTDGILITRYLLGLRGNNLMPGDEAAAEEVAEKVRVLQHGAE